MIAAAYRWAYALYLRWTIWEAESHLRSCETDGLIDSYNLRECRAQIAADRVRLYLLQPSPQTRVQARGALALWQSFVRRGPLAGPVIEQRGGAHG